MAIGSKNNETRGRRCHIRGDVVICATKARLVPSIRVSEILWDTSLSFGARDFDQLLKSLPYGKAICVVEIYDCIPTFDVYGIPPKHPIGSLEQQLGDYSHGRFAWLTRNVRVFKKPFQVRAGQGWFEIPTELVMKNL